MGICIHISEWQERRISPSICEYMFLSSVHTSVTFAKINMYAQGGPTGRGGGGMGGFGRGGREGERKREGREEDCRVSLSLSLSLSLPLSRSLSHFSSLLLYCSVSPTCTHASVRARELSLLICLCLLCAKKRRQQLQQLLRGNSMHEEYIDICVCVYIYMCINLFVYTYLYG